MEIQNHNSDFFQQEKEFFGQDSEIFDQSDEIFPQMEEIHSTGCIAGTIPAYYNRHKKLFGGRIFMVAAIMLVMYSVNWSNDGYGLASEDDFTPKNDSSYFSNSESYTYDIERITYTVQAGDTLWDIAKKYMGDGLGYHTIVEENHLSNPDLIFPGDVLVIPIVHSTGNWLESIKNFIMTFIE